MHSSKIKVVQVITRLIKGGAQQVCLDIAGGLPPDYYEVYLVSGPQTGTEGSFWDDVRQIKDIRIKLIPELVRDMSPFKDLMALVKLFWWFSQIRPAVVHCHTSKAGFIGCLAAWLARVPVIIYSPHGHIFAVGSRIPSVSGSVWRVKLFYYLRRLASFLSTKIIALNEADKEEQVTLQLSPPGKYEVIYNGIEIKKPLNRAPSSRYPVLATVGRLSPEKGQRYLLEAVNLVRNNYPETLLLVIGDGPLRNELESYTEKLGIKNNVQFLGIRDNIEKYLSDADLFILPSLYEAFGLVLLEAMAVAKPVIASRVNGIPEVVIDNRTGLLVPPANPVSLAGAIIKLAADHELGRTFGQAGYQRVREIFTREKMVNKFAHLYKRLLNRYENRGIYTG